MNGLAKKKWFVPVVLFLLLIIAVSSFSESRGSDSLETTDTERRLEELCNLVRGVSNAKVMITYEAKTVSSIIGQDRTENTISGIAIVCDGGADPIVQLELHRLIDALFDISSTRITVSQRN